MQCARQVAHDVADTADFAAWQCAVLCGNKKDLPGSDNGLPQLNA
jgi:hypothetical protein